MILPAKKGGKHSLSLHPFKKSVLTPYEYYVTTGKRDVLSHGLTADMGCRLGWVDT